MAADYYVDPKGDDAADGLSPQKAWQTLTRVEKQALKPGDHLLLKNGVDHVGPLRIKQAGTRVDPIVVSGYGIAKSVPTIKGGEYCIDASTSHLRIDGLRLTGATNPQRGAIMVWADRDLENIDIVSCHIDKNAGRGIWISGEKGRRVTDVRISRNRITDNAGSGMQITKLIGGRVENNEITGNCATPVDKWQAGVRLWSSDVHDVVIASNFIRNVEKPDGDVSGMGIHLDEVGLNVVAKDNVIMDCASAGIEIENCRKVEVSNNIIRNVHTGIFVYRAGHDHLITHNTVVARALGIVLQGHRAGGIDAGDEVMQDGKLATGNRVTDNIAMAGRWASLKINGAAELGNNIVQRNHFGEARASLFQWGKADFDSLAKFEAVAGDTKAVSGDLINTTIHEQPIPQLPGSTVGAKVD